MIHAKNVTRDRLLLLGRHPGKGNPPSSDAQPVRARTTPRATVVASALKGGRAAPSPRRERGKRTRRGLYNAFRSKRIPSGKPRHGSRKRPTLAHQQRTRNHSTSRTRPAPVSKNKPSAKAGSSTWQEKGEAARITRRWTRHRQSGLATLRAGQNSALGYAASLPALPVSVSLDVSPLDHAHHHYHHRIHRTRAFCAL